MSEICGHIGGDDTGAITTVCQQPKGHAGKHGGMGCEWDDAATPGRHKGDRGQRYEIHSRPPFAGDGSKTLVGWHETLDGATRMADAAVLHPMSTEAWVNDRADRQKQVYETRKPTR